MSDSVATQPGARGAGAFDGRFWSVILGGSSGFGLATAHKLSRHGMNLCLVHRDRRSALARIEEEFAAIRSRGVRLLTFNCDATAADARAKVIGELRAALGPGESVRMLLHSIAFGNLKPLAPGPRAAAAPPAAVDRLAERLGVPAERLVQTAQELAAAGVDGLEALTPAPPQPDGTLGEDDFAHTIHAMGTSLVGWVQGLLEAGVFAPDARVLSMTSEGNTVAWRGYAAVSAAKVALEAVSRSLALECAPLGLRANVVQAGVAETPALKLIPGADRLAGSARQRNPFGRLTTPADVADVIYLLCLDEAAWINGTIIRVDGGEHIAGV
ncbi:MAG: SDR family oxidoreductase [Candidatus Binatia bacterium]